MNDHLLTTKFYPTILSQDFVLRKRLLTLLDLGLSAKLTLISAPAGFGKSSLVANWEARRNEPIAWLKLDKSDNQVSNFISYVYAALGKAYPDFDQKKLPVPDNFHEDEFIKLANLLLNEITSITKQVILVIDDYHLITNEKIHTYLEYLIEHLPPQTHIYLLSRIDPPLSLARWRARGELQEVRARDLKFKQDEINKYITQSAKFTLNTNQLALIQEKTEGWITGIKLTVLSLSRQQDFNQLSKLLSGNQEYIADYLVDEVLSNLPEDIQSFLLQTSILTYLLADLCNTVTGLEDSQRILEKLVSENLFIFALDATRSWFQYHYLFSELLRKRLYMFQRDLTATLYRRAIDWHVRRGMINEAVNYAIDMRDEKTLFSLIESNILHQILQGEFFQAQTWLAELPKELIWQQPILCLASAWINTRNLSIEQAYKFVDRAEELLRKNNSSIQITQRDKIVEHIAALRASLARTIGRPPEEQLILINKALNIISEEKKILRGLLILRKGLCYLDLEKDAEADQIFNQLIRLHIKGNYYPLYGAIYARTVIAYLQGRLHDIKDICVETLEHTENNLNNPWQKVEVQGFAYIALGMVELEWNNLENAYNYLNRGLSLNTSSGLTELQVKGQYSLGRLGIAEGKDIEPIDQSKFRGNALPHMEKFAKALQAHLWLLASNSLPQKQDAFNKAVRWASHQSLMPSKGYDRDWQIKSQLIFVRIVLAMRQRNVESFLTPKISKILEMLNEELETYKAKVWWDRVLEILIIKILVLDVLGRTDEALEIMLNALELAKPAGYVRLFLDEGDQIVKYLYASSNQMTSAGNYARHLLAQFTETPSHISYINEDQDVRIEPLTRRELEILKLIANGLTNKEIGQKLSISLGTVKRHAANINGKLNTDNRTRAVVVARKLKIIN